MEPMSSKEARAFLSRGTADVVPKNDVLQLLLSEEKFSIKYGIDPTTPDLHLGYFAVLRRIKKLAARGHKAAIVLGTFTGRFGDPTGKTNARILRDSREVEQNAKALALNIRKYFGDVSLTIFRNSTWFDKMTLNEFFNIAAQFTFAQLRERDLFEARQRAGKELYLHEFLYPVLQAYDSIAVNSGLTIIGSDQLFNELAARRLQQHRGRTPQGIITLKILPGTDGEEKMSQSSRNTIGIFEDPDIQYGKIMAVPDGALLVYAELLTDLPLTPFKLAFSQRGIPARNAKMRVAHTIIAEIWGAQAAKLAEHRFVKRFQKKEIPTDLPEAAVRSRTVIDVLHEAKLVGSRNAARRLVKQRGVKINGMVVEAPDVIVEDGATLFIGKQRMVRIRRVA